ncbi:MAG: hypothetical protein L6R42_003196 [Xanthoria sp. 1 TBL-2021]|nr:MAG: hypothetical protein L6R42_003196 [Xanthoria sp. 1 TBL-2021]
MPSIKLKTEPEAATLTTKDKAEGDILENRTEDENLEVNDAFIVCDDLISYEVQQLDPLKFKERAIGDGGLSSSMFLDPSFQKSIQTIVGEAQSSTVKKSKRKKTNGFEYGIKRTSGEKNDQVYSVDLQGVKDGSKTSVVDDTLTVTMYA